MIQVESCYHQALKLHVAPSGRGEVPEEGVRNPALAAGTADIVMSMKPPSKLVADSVLPQVGR